MGLLNAGVNLGPMQAGITADAQLPAAIDSLFPFTGGANGGAGVNLGANGGAGVNLDANAHAGNEESPSGHGEGHGNADGGIGVNLGGDSGVAGSVDVGGGAAEHGIGGEINGEAGHAGGEHGAVGVTMGVHLSPVPIISMTSPSKPGTPQCTVQGGPAKILYFHPAGQQGSLDSNNNQDGPAPPASAAGTPYATHGQVFHPGSAYISCETLFAAYTDDRGSTIQTGPTFTNAIFPFPSDQISTQCVDAKQTDAPFNQGTQMDFGLAGSPPSSCMNVVAPTAMASLVPEWSDYLFWNMDFQPPEQICTEGAPEPQGPAWSGPPPECSCKPTVVLPTSTEVSTASASTTVAPVGGSSPVPTTAATLSGPLPPTFGAYTASLSAAAASSSSMPAQFTGAAASSRSRSGKAAFGLGVMLVAMLLL